MSGLDSVKLPLKPSVMQSSHSSLQSRVLHLTSVQEEVSLQMFVNTSGNCIFDSSKQRGPEGQRILRSLIKMLLGMASGYMPCETEEIEIRKYCSYTFIH